MEQQKQFDIYPDNKNVGIALCVFLVPMLGGELWLAYSSDSLFVQLFFTILALIMAGFIIAILKNANSKLLFVDDGITIINGKKTKLPYTNLREFQVIYYLNLTWRYVGKYRIGDPIGKAVWDTARYCVFASEEIDDDALYKLSWKLRDKAPSGMMDGVLAFNRDSKFFPIMETYFSETATVHKKSIKLEKKRNN